jgi:N-acetyl-gamma-glutamyl-phosphate reductase
MSAKKIKVGIIGVLGYAGEELLKILARHPYVEISYLGDKLEKNVKAGELFPKMAGVLVRLECVNVDVKKDLAAGLKDADVVFLALPHSVSMGMVPELLDAGKRVIDLSADYRLKDADVYEKWYAHKHSFPDLLSKAVYGLPELYREKIKKATLIATPGCYPTSVILGCAPLLKERVIGPQVIVDAKSGISGGGRAFAKKYLKANADDTYPYNAGGAHRHIPEMEQELINNGAAPGTKVVFTPNIVPQERGMISSIYIPLKSARGVREFRSVYSSFYSGEPFVRVLADELPRTSDVTGTNFCEIGMVLDERSGVLIVFSAIDNLLKGASGQAVQNMNIIFGFDERTSLSSS